MPTPGERLALLLEVHDDSLRMAAERCGVDHTTLMRIKNGDTENPASLAKIAEGYGVPVNWMRGDRDLATDFALTVLSRPLQERVMFLWQRERRLAFALCFLRDYAPETNTIEHLADVLHLSSSEVHSTMIRGLGTVTPSQLESLCSNTGLPMDWFRTGLIGQEDEHELLIGLTVKALATVSARFKVGLTEAEIHEMAIALV